MNWTQVVLAFVASAVLASFTDWYFFGVLFHERYRATPGVWRQYKDKMDEMRSIAISELFMSISSLVFIVASAHQGWTSLSRVAREHDLELAHSSWLVLNVFDWRFHHRIDSEASKVSVMAAARRENAKAG